MAEPVKAILFDTFGTIVDWRGSIIAEGKKWGEEKGLKVDWAAFADAWRAGYGPAMKQVEQGQLPWMNIDTLHRMILEEILVEFGIEGLTEEEKKHWNRVWHRLQPWPDSAGGLAPNKSVERSAMTGIQLGERVGVAVAVRNHQCLIGSVLRHPRKSSGFGRSRFRFGPCRTSISAVRRVGHKTVWKRVRDGPRTWNDAARDEVGTTVVIDCDDLIGGL